MMSGSVSIAAMLAVCSLLMLPVSGALAEEGYPSGIELIECSTPDLEILHIAGQTDRELISQSAVSAAEFLVVSNSRIDNDPHLILAISMPSANWNEDCAIRISQLMDFSGMQQRYATANPDAQVPLPQLTVFRHVFSSAENDHVMSAKTAIRRLDLEAALPGTLCLELVCEQGSGWQWDSTIWPCLFHAKTLSIELISPLSGRSELMIDQQSAETMLEFHADQAGIAVDFQALHNYYLWDSKQGNWTK